MALDKNKKILVVGLGLIGGSYAAALSRNGFEVGAVDRDPDAIGYALEAGYIRHGSVTAEPDYIGGFDIVVFALYPSVLLDWVEKNARFFKKGALITDVTGVKSGIVFRVQELLPPGTEFVGAHPMAGREVSGVTNASPDLFCGANFIVTPTPANTEEAIRLCEDLGRELGSGTVSRLSPAEHDEMIGFLSQLTHCIAVALMSCKESRHLVDYTGDSFRDLTRIAKINENMWSELFLMNRDELLSQMDLFLEHFTILRNALERGDAETMKSMMRLSTERRRYFDKKQ
ncbi:MAG TPA: prephenate dehydrogenase/arogenate dehydrogenase family protein [Clostridiales bacterium]|nr:prephenate dehydrogenase/arogenate dehydrogenase family protein [Clostridiales bacterium]